MAAPASSPGPASAHEGAHVTAVAVARIADEPADHRFKGLPPDAAGRTLATADDRSATDRDAELRFKSPADGPVFLCLQDANDRGSTVHAYLLEITQE